MKKTNEDGYMLVTTLLLLILSGLFLQATIHIYSNQIIQFKQFSSAYEYKAALNIAETVLKEIVEDEKEGKSVEGTIETSLGPIKIEKITEDSNRLTIYTQKGSIYSKDIKYNTKEDKKQEEQEIINDDNIDFHELESEKEKSNDELIEVEENENIQDQEEKKEQKIDIQEFVD